MVSLYLYQMLILTDFMGENTLREEIGWSLLGTVFLSAIINMIKFTINVYKVMRPRCKRRCTRKRRAEIYKENTNAYANSGKMIFEST